MRFGLPKLATRPTASVARARIGLYILAVRIAVVAVALREIIARPRGGGSAGDGAARTADDGTGRGSARPPGQEPAQHATDNGAANRACARIRRGWRRRLVRARRRRIGCRGCIPIDHVIGVIVGDIGRRTVHWLRVVIPDAADIPPPAVAAIVHLMAPAPAFPSEMAAIGVTAKIVRRYRAAAREMGVRAPARNAPSWMLLKLHSSCRMLLELRGPCRMRRSPDRTRRKLFGMAWLPI